MVRVLRIICLVLISAGAALAQDDDSLRLEIVFDPRAQPAYEGEMLLATLRGVYRHNITNEELKLRQMPDFDWTRLDHDLWRDDRVAGRAAKVFERRLAFFPKRPGRLEIPPIAHELEVLGPGGTREIRLVRSAAVAVDILPKPVTGGAGWLPVRALELSDHWSSDPAALEDGQLVERRVILRALGATPEMMPQQPPMREPWLITFSPPKQTNMEITPEGPVTTVEWRWKLRPITGEPGVIPEVVIAYYDTTEQRAATVIVPSSPIGYASFSDNAASGWARDLGPFGPLAAVFLATLATAVAFSLRTQRMLPQPLRRLMGVARKRVLGLRLGYLLRRRRLAEYRRAAAIALRRAGVAADRRAALLSRLDAAIYGRQDPPAHRHLRALHRAIRNKIGTG